MISHLVGGNITYVDFCQKNHDNTLVITIKFFKGLVELSHRRTIDLYSLEWCHMHDHSIDRFYHREAVRSTFADFLFRDMPRPFADHINHN